MGGWCWDSFSPQGMYDASAFFCCFVLFPNLPTCFAFSFLLNLSSQKSRSLLACLSFPNTMLCYVNKGQNLVYLNGVKSWSQFHYLFDTAGQWSTHLCNSWVITTYTENRLSAADQIHTCSTLNKPYILKHTFTTIEEK